MIFLWLKIKLAIFEKVLQRGVVAQFLEHKDWNIGSGSSVG
jgi:hypothetical protein